MDARKEDEHAFSDRPANGVPAKFGGRSGRSFDPEMLRDAAIVGAYHFEAGTRAFAEWGSAMLRDIGEAVRPHLVALYNRSRQALIDAADRRLLHGTLSQEERARLSTLEREIRAIPPMSGERVWSPEPGPESTSGRKPTSHEAALMRAFKLKSLGELRQLLGTRIRDLSPEGQRYLARCGLTSHGPEQPPVGIDEIPRGPTLFARWRRFAVRVSSTVLPIAIPTAASVSMLVIGAFGREPYGYFQLERLVVCASSIWLALQSGRRPGAQRWSGATWGLAILFNPFAPVDLNRAQWQAFDLAAAVVLAAYGVALLSSGSVMAEPRKMKPRLQIRGGVFTEKIAEGVRRLAIFAGILGAIAGGFYAHHDLLLVPSDRYQYNVFERLAASDIVKQERQLLLAASARGATFDWPYETPVPPLPPKADARAAPREYDGWTVVGKSRPITPSDLAHASPAPPDHGGWQVVSPLKPAADRGASGLAAAKSTSASSSSEWAAAGKSRPMTLAVATDGIKAIYWSPDFRVDWFDMQDGGTVYSGRPPSAWSYALWLVFPALGFFILWGAIRGIGWVAAGFLETPRQPPTI